MHSLEVKSGRVEISQTAATLSGPFTQTDRQTDLHRTLSGPSRQTDRQTGRSTQDSFWSIQTDRQTQTDRSTQDSLWSTQTDRQADLHRTLPAECLHSFSSRTGQGYGEASLRTGGRESSGLSTQPSKSFCLISGVNEVEIVGW